MARRVTSESWEDFDAKGLFPPPRLHTNCLTKVDSKGMTKVSSSDNGEESGGSTPEELGDTYADASASAGHADEMFEFEMEDLDVSSSPADERELKADKKEDKRTHKEETPEAPAESEDFSGKAAPKEQAEPQDQDGADQPIQKDSEGVKEVAEATSKTSEDVHGGDEATKDIADSPNAANDGQNPDNHGAEAGDSSPEADEAEAEDGGEGEGDSEGSSAGDADGSNAEGEASGDPFASEDWEAKAEQSAVLLKLQDQLEQLEAKARDEKGHRTSLPRYNFNREASPVELEIAFKKAGELLKKFAAEEDITARKDGSARWDAKQIVRSVVSYRHQRIPSAKYERPKEADICILLDISSSCAQQAEMFMAIAAGSIGSGVRVFVGYNGSCRASAMNPPQKRIHSYAQAKPWVEAEVTRVSGWNNAVAIGEWNFGQFLEEARPKTVIIFGDWDGINQYEVAVRDPRFRSVKFFWFANEGSGSWRSKNADDRIPEGFSRKNYFPDIFTPRDFVKGLRRLK